VLLKTLWTAIALVAAAAGALSWLAWKCDRDPKINFLPRDGRAEWIVFPAAMDVRSHPVATMDATFRRTFTLDSQPGPARLLVCAAKRVELKINGETVQIVSTRNWKQISTLDVSKFFRPGLNTIEARVFNDDAPPALWLALTADSSILRSDDKWEVSLAGSTWRSSALASTPKRAGPGNLLAGGERTSDVLPKIWRTWTALAVLAVLLTIAAGWWFKPNGGGAKFSRPQLLALLGLCGIAWFVLFWNNAKMLPFHCGYDFKDHIAYIKYVQDHGALPLPNEGFEMFQPPLYYAVSAAALSICRLAVADDAAVTVLRAMTMIFGIANFSLVFLSVRLLFPGRLVAQIVGLLAAAFLPMQLYLSHYVTNETLAATLVTATIYLCLRMLKYENAPALQYLWLGAFAGLAMLAKATSLLLIPPLFCALMIKLLQERAPIVGWFRAFGAIIAAILVICGWHYARIWHHFGTPIVGNWDPALGFPWWQDPGFHVARDYFRFGAAFISPLFSGFDGFADGIYSTLWGDSLCGGLSDLISRTPWNYNLVVGGYLLAVVPTFVAVLGAGVAIYRFVRAPSSEWVLLLGLAAAIVFGVIFMTLRVPSYAQVKAFYGLAALTPLCAFAATGFGFLSDKWPRSQFVLTALLLFWALNSFASMWIVESPARHLHNAARLSAEQKIDRAYAEASIAVALDSSSATAQRFFSGIALESERLSEALEHAERSVQLAPSSSEAHAQLGAVRFKQNDLEGAVNEARRAIELGMENKFAHAVSFTSLRRLQRNHEAIEVARNALVLSPFDSELHYRLALAAGQTGDFATAAEQFGYALLLQPKSTDAADRVRLAMRFAAKAPNASQQLATIAASAPDSPILLKEIAWLRATAPANDLRNGAEAVRLAERACFIAGDKQPMLIATLAAAYAEVGKFSEATAAAQNALSLARSSGDAKTAELAENLLIAFQSNQPYREEPRP
jgi:tetratricopeptide (TPR) repeat protein